VGQPQKFIFQHQDFQKLLSKDPLLYPKEDWALVSNDHYLRFLVAIKIPYIHGSHLPLLELCPSHLLSVHTLIEIPHPLLQVLGLPVLNLWESLIS
jgi:hypothetical protein